MKSIILLTFLFLSMFLSGQYRDDNNRFSQSSHDNSSQHDNAFHGNMTGEKHQDPNDPRSQNNRGPGAVGEPASIDDPLIYLLIAALVIINLVTYKKNSVRLR